MLPLTGMVYLFQTEQRTDSFAITTGVGETTANVTLVKFIYDDDTSTIEYNSSIAESPSTSTYNGTTKTLLIAGLTDNTSRSMTVAYDVDAIAAEGAAISSLLTRIPGIYLILIVSFPVVALLAIFLGKG
jgi:hypothetical protein